MYVAYTDSACKTNPGPFGFAVIFVRKNKVVKVLRGGGKHGTNNVAEMLAVYEAIKDVPEGSLIRIYTDSQYVCRALDDGWIFSWAKAGWKRKKGALKNKEIWQQIYELMKTRDIHISWVKGHADNSFNELADQMAVEAVDKFGEFNGDRKYTSEYILNT